MYNPAPIFKFVEAKQALGQAVVLVTIAAASASSSRNPGAHLAVSQDGAMIGSLTGGCIEAAVAAEALEVLREGRPRITLYGQGSRFLDIRLPCGGSLDILFSPLRDPQIGAKLVEHLARRDSERTCRRAEGVVAHHARYYGDQGPDAHRCAGDQVGGRHHACASGRHLAGAQCVDGADQADFSACEVSPIRVDSAVSLRPAQR